MIDAKYTARLNNWRRLMASVSPEGTGRVTIFMQACDDIATVATANGLDRGEAADELTSMATAHGLGDPDAVQWIISQAFDRAKAAPKNKPDLHLVETSSTFAAQFMQLDYLVDGILQRRFLYAFTGKTGSGKTAIALLIAASVALGRKIGDIEVAQGRVLYFAGENPDDIRMRWIAMAEHMDFDLDKIEVYFITKRFRISEMKARIFAEIERVGEVALVVIDTSAAYYEGTEVNSNTEQAAHARRFRELIALPGGPTVLVNCHPVKNAAPDNLLPLGAGAFLNEIDGNLICIVDWPAVEMHWQGKFRGADFDPLSFRLDTVTHQRLKTTKGKLIPTVVAKPLSEIAKEEIAKANLTDRQRLLAEIESDGKASVADYAARCMFTLKNGLPHKRKAHALIKGLKKDKLIDGESGDYTVTGKGERKTKKKVPE